MVQKHGRGVGTQGTLLVRSHSILMAFYPILYYFPSEILIFSGTVYHRLKTSAIGFGTL